MVPLLEKTPLASQKDFQRIVKNLPKGLAAIYESFLCSIPVEYRETAALLLHFIAGSRRLLSLDEIGVLLALKDTQQSISSIAADSQPNMHETLEIILGLMIRISEGRVSFVHQTAKEFLSRLHKEPDHPLSKLYGIDQVNADLLMARSCVSYLLLHDFSMDIFTEDEGGIRDPPTSPICTSSAECVNDIWDDLDLGDTIFIRDYDVAESRRCSFIARKYAFFDYSAVHWASHFACCNSICPEDLQLLALEVSQSSTNKFSNWFRYYWSQHEAGATLPIDFNPFIIACFFGHLITVAFLQDTRVPIDMDTAACGLFWASYKGHSHVVSQLLLRHTPVHWEIANHDTTLISAARFNHLDVVQALLEAKEINVNSKGKDGRTALSKAAGNGHLAIVDCLLRHRAIQPDIADSSGWTPIFWAVGGKYVEVVQRLFTNNGVGSNYADKDGRSVFSWAAEAGDVDIVELFLARESIYIKQSDSRGMTALAWAAKSGNIDIVSTMRRSKGVDISPKNNEGRNAISLAAAGGHHDVVAYLLKHDPAGADMEDNDGWAPLAWALDNDAPVTVQALLSSGRVDPNRKDKNGRTALSWAAGYGYVEVTKRIMDAKGAKVDERDNSGRTALGWAKLYGFGEVVEVLERT
ncbi:hypothetical protein VE02_06737 [Pseudogymnoascus sp. 03VT05]|nr:hypothetical protein VE02_06737 [Pseudogymnoascus sp. 03VT05]